MSISELLNSELAPNSSNSNNDDMNRGKRAKSEDRATGRVKNADSKDIYAK